MNVNGQEIQPRTVQVDVEIPEHLKNCHNCKSMPKDKRFGVGMFKCLEYSTYENNSRKCAMWAQWKRS